jgi:hypothetical protein
VSKVWNTVDTHQKKGLTSVIHGKYGHEETVATVSFAEDYICVKNLKEAEMVADYIVNGGDKEAFLKYFENAISKGFDPDVMLQKVGLANQTTMYKKETREIGQLLQKAIMKKFGPVEASKHYMEFDTICDATQVSLIRTRFPFHSWIFQLTRTSLLHRSDKMLSMSWWRKTQNWDWISFWWLADGTHPIQDTCWKSRYMRAFVRFTLTGPNAFMATILSHIERSMVRL